ncbi:MAG TPA: trypsin-like peptidase domain-containing protein [Candidatus Dormibacteraeota bacterium]|nr:trypsin-like peptidase domain-containing protein [Candidatus Dormibacteraeota bacterium]
MIEPDGPESPSRPRTSGAGWITPGTFVASLLVAAIAGGAVAAGVTLGILHLQSRSSPPPVLVGGATVSDASATAGVAQKAAPAVVSVITDEKTLAHGSGFLVTSDGYVVTTIGVVANSRTLEVLVPTSGGLQRYEARLVDYDCETGLALLKVDHVANLATLPLGDSTGLGLGQSVVVVSGPLTAAGVVSRGVVSALQRTVTVSDGHGGTLQIGDVFQTDAPVQPDAAGAPVVDLSGQVVGIVASAEGAPGPGAYALSSSDVQQEVQQAVQTGQLVVPTLGASTVEVTSDQVALHGGVVGARVTSVDAGGPAAAELQVGDVITRIDAQEVDDAHPLPQLLRTHFQPGQRVTVTYQRNGAVSQVQLTLDGGHPACP